MARKEASIEFLASPDEDDDFPMIICPDDIEPRWIKDEGRLNTLEIKLRYQWSRDVKYLDESSEYFGPCAASTLSEVFSREDHDLKHYHRIAVYVAQELVDSLIAHNQSRAGRRGYMTWRHVTAFARVADLDLQQELLGLCLANDWNASRLCDEISERDERLRSKTSKSRRPSLKPMLMRVGAITSDLVDETLDLHRCLLQQPQDKLPTIAKTTARELDAVRQSITASINRMQDVLIVLERGQAIIAAKPNRRQSQTKIIEGTPKPTPKSEMEDPPKLASAKRSVVSDREADHDTGWMPAPASPTPKRRLTRRFRRRTPKHP